MESFYTRDELEKIGFGRVGIDVLISRKASIYGAEDIKIGNHVRIDDFCFLSGKIDIGNYVHIAVYSALYGSYGIKIEDYVNVSGRVNIYSTSDDYSGQYMTGPMVGEEYIHDIGVKVVIKKHSIIGAGSIILPGVILEEGTAIGAMSLVKKSTEPFGIYAGIPADKIKDRMKTLLNLEKQMIIDKGEGKCKRL